MNDKNATTPLPGTRAHGIILALLQGGTLKDSKVMEAWWVLVRAVDAVILKKALAKSGSGGGIVPLPLQSAPDGLSVEGVDALVAFARDFDKAAIEEKSRAPADPDDYLFRALEEVEGDLNGKKPLKGEEI